MSGLFQAQGFRLGGDVLLLVNGEPQPIATLSQGSPAALLPPPNLPSEARVERLQLLGDEEKLQILACVEEWCHVAAAWRIVTQQSEQLSAQWLADLEQWLGDATLLLHGLESKSEKFLWRHITLNCFNDLERRYAMLELLLQQQSQPKTPLAMQSGTPQTPRTSCAPHTPSELLGVRCRSPSPAYASSERPMRFRRLTQEPASSNCTVGWPEMLNMHWIAMPRNA